MTIPGQWNKSRIFSAPKLPLKGGHVPSALHCSPWSGGLPGGHMADCIGSSSRGSPRQAPPAGASMVGTWQTSLWTQVMSNLSQGMMSKGGTAGWARVMVPSPGGPVRARLGIRAPHERSWEWWQWQLKTGEGSGALWQSPYSPVSVTGWLPAGAGWGGPKWADLCFPAVQNTNSAKILPFFLAVQRALSVQHHWERGTRSASCWRGRMCRAVAIGLIGCICRGSW